MTLRVWILSVLCLDERLLLHRDGFCRTGQVARSGTDYGGKEDDPAETKTVSADLDRAFDLNCDTSSASYGFSVSNRMLSPFA